MEATLLVELLDQRTQDRFEQALAANGFEREAAMQDEAIAALAIVAQHPPKLRHIALAIVSSPAREELDAYTLIERVDEQGVAWTLTDRGEATAAVLAAAVPPRSAEQRERDSAQLAKMLAQASEVLRDRP